MSSLSDYEKNRYGQLPKVIGIVECNPIEMMFYQDMPIKLKGSKIIKYEERLNCFDNLIQLTVNSFKQEYGEQRFFDSNVYISAKHLFQHKDKPFNRSGWHCDGFMSEDINYVWSDILPTLFNFSEFNLTQDHNISIQEMQIQANPENDIYYPEKSLVRLNQYNVHRVADVVKDGMRAFVKISFSFDKFILQGNTKNYLLSYDWNMKPRYSERNVPQQK